MSDTESDGENAHNKRQAQSPAEGSEDDVKRRNVLSKVDLGNLTSDQAKDKVEVAISDQQLPPKSDSPKGTIKPATVDELAVKVDSLTVKMDKVLEYLVTQKEKSDAQDQLNNAKLKLLESSHNQMIDKIGHIDLDMVSCLAKTSQNTIDIEGNVASINALETQVRMLKAADCDKEIKLKDMEKKMDKMQKVISEAKGSILDLGMEVRDRRVMICGIRESPHEDLIGVALDELNKLMKSVVTQKKSDATDSPKETDQQGRGSTRLPRRPQFRLLVLADIDNAYRLGVPLKGKNKKPRNISVSFTAGYIKGMILAAKSSSKVKTKGIYINEDLRPEARALRADLKLLAVGAKSLGHETKISGNKLTIGTERYSPEELPAIDKDIIDASKQELILEDGIAFKGCKSIFSNFFPAPLMIDDVEYANVEQYYQFRKATEKGDHHLARKIMLKDDPQYCKTAGKRVETTDEWRAIRLRELYKGIYAKFDQNGPLKQALLATAGQNLYEATTDLFFGCGITLDSDKWKTGDWQGVNVCGKLLMKIRNEFLEEATLGQSSNNTLMDIMNSPMSASAISDEAKDEEWPLLDTSSTSRMSYKEAVAGVSSAATGDSSTVLPVLIESTPQITEKQDVTVGGTAKKSQLKGKKTGAVPQSFPL